MEFIMTTLGFSANSISAIMSKDGWVDIYNVELNERLANAKNNSFPEKYFIHTIKPLLDQFVGDRQNTNIRKIIQKWMMIYLYKARAILRIQYIEKEDKKKYEIIQTKYAGIPIGPLGEDEIEAMTIEERKRWHEGNIANEYAWNNHQNILGLFCSEMFFTVEAACRVICIGACLDFSIKSLFSNMVIQHDEVYKTLKRIGQLNTEKVTCITCANKDKCTGLPQITDIVSLYEICYHLRVIKDYKIEFYWHRPFEEFVKNNYLKKGIDILFIFEEVIRAIFSNYLRYPRTLKDDEKDMPRFIFQL